MTTFRDLFKKGAVQAAQKDEADVTTRSLPIEIEKGSTQVVQQNEDGVMTGT